MKITKRKLKSWRAHQRWYRWLTTEKVLYNMANRINELHGSHLIDSRFVHPEAARLVLG